MSPAVGSGADARPPGAADLGADLLAPGAHLAYRQRQRGVP